MGYQRQALSGLSWVGLFRSFLRASSLIRTVILARILSPHEFGVFGIATIVLGLLEMFTETGVNVILIQEDRRHTNSYLNTGFTVSILRGILISLLILISIPVVVSFYQEPAVIRLLLIISLVPLLRGFINPAEIVFQQQLKFKQEFFFKSCILLADATVAILTAIYFKTADSLVYGILAGVIAELAISHLFIKPSPKFEFKKDQFLHMLHQGKWITGAGVFSFLASKVPDISLGKLVSTNALGLYQMAYRFSVLPVEELIEIFNRVAFPVYRLIHSDQSRLKRAIVRNVLVFWSISMSICMTIYFLSPFFIPLILGVNWISIVPIVQLLTLTGLLISLSTPVNPIYLATKQQKYLTLTTLVQMLFVMILIVPMTSYLGLVGTINAFNLSILLTLPLRWYLAYRSIVNNNLKKS